MCVTVANRRESAEFVRSPTGADAGDDEDDTATRMASAEVTTMPQVMFPGNRRTMENAAIVRALTHVVSGERGSTMATGGEWVAGVAAGGGSASSPSSSFSSSSWGGGGGGSSSSGVQKRGREEEAGLPEPLLRYYRGGFGDTQTYQGEASAEAGM